MQQLEVTLAHRPTAMLPQISSRIAQHHQEGSGDETPADRANHQSAQAGNAREEEEAALQVTQQQNATHSHRLHTTALTRPKVVSEPLTPQAKHQSKTAASTEAKRLGEEIAALEAALRPVPAAFNEQPRVRRLDAASARRSVDAAYLLDWRRRLEAVGNQYYPRASIRYGIYGDLRLLVVIRQDGSLEDIKVLSSSGYAVLDEAAIKIVRMAAPYAPFPRELRATTDKLEIVRTWHFQEKQLSSP